MPKPKSISQPEVINTPENPVATDTPVRDNGSPIEQAIHLRGVLREALSATNDLVRSLKRQQKQQRAYKSAIASLKELQGVA